VEINIILPLTERHPLSKSTFTAVVITMNVTMTMPNHMQKDNSILAATMAVMSQFSLII